MHILQNNSQDALISNRTQNGFTQIPTFSIKFQQCERGLRYTTCVGCHPRLKDFFFFFSFLNLGFRQRSDPSYELEYWQRPILNPHPFRWSPPGFSAPVVTHSLWPVFCLDRLFVILTSTAQRSSESSQNRPNPSLIGGITTRMSCRRRLTAPCGTMITLTGLSQVIFVQLIKRAVYVLTEGKPY